MRAGGLHVVAVAHRDAFALADIAGDVQILAAGHVEGECFLDHRHDAPENALVKDRERVPVLDDQVDAVLRQFDQLLAGAELLESIYDWQSLGTTL